MGTNTSFELLKLQKFCVLIYLRILVALLLMLLSQAKLSY